jgi:predicted PurR-regulated permease PerM
MSVIADSYPFLDIMWTMFIFFAWVIWVAFLIFILVDNFKRHDHSGLAKAGWTVLLLFVPVIGALIYIIARPPMEPARA